MKFPNLIDGEFAVIMSDNRTGIILDKNQEIYKNDPIQEVYSIFENISQAYDFIKSSSLINDNLEFIIYNFKQEVIDFVKPNK